MHSLVRCLSDYELHEVEQLCPPGRIFPVDYDFVYLPNDMQSAAVHYTVV